MIDRTKKKLQLLAGLAVVAISWCVAGVRPLWFLEPGALRGLGGFLGGLLPPDLSSGFLKVVAQAILRTLAIAVAGTALSIALALPLGVLATPALFQRGIVLAGEPPGRTKTVFAVLSRATGAILRFMRAVPDLSWALLFVVAVGLGPLAGTLAVAVSYAGMLGRVYADVFDEVDPGPVEALHSTGATRAQLFVYAIWPQARTKIASYTVYSFECCVRAASVLGFVGAGGVGYEINMSMKLFEYGQVLTLIAAFLLLVGLADSASRWLRARLGRNAVVSKREIRAGWAVAVVVIAASFPLAGFADSSLLGTSLPARVLHFVAGMFPPDLDPAFLRSLVEPIVVTIAIAVIGSLIGLAIGAVVALPAARNVTLADATAGGRTSFAERFVRRLAYSAARRVLGLLRSIPELVWVLMCIVAVGLGPFAGALAIGLHTGGVLGKLYAETIEEVAEGPLEALRATGAGRLGCLVWGIWPQARRMLESYTLLRFEANLRVSTVLGLVGAGGLGQALYNNVQLGFHTRVTTLIALIYVLVALSDRLNDRFRRRAGGLGVVALQ